ncbi:MAG TPA: SEC-C metal-binding domain-containing protein [Solirubrobacteraceae bacterium]|nr:SEC-C metal-binding domain-containing protein [Solirubrobacteraceae bacterium]
MSITDRFHHIDRPMRAMAALLATGRAPAELMAVYAAEDARRGHNEPCTCGSGRKCKHCHGGSQIEDTVSGPEQATL